MDNVKSHAEPVTWETLARELETARWKPTSKDVWVAIRETSLYYRQGKLTEPEFKWAMSFLAGKLLEFELAEVFNHVGPRLESKPSRIRA